MKFKGKSVDPAWNTKESVYDPKSEKFHEFTNGIFETEDEQVIALLKGWGYETIDAPPTEDSFKCDKCEFVAKNGTGLSAHTRSHKEI